MKNQEIRSQGEQEKNSSSQAVSSPLNALQSVEKRDVFFIMVLHPFKGWIRAGNAYASKKVAHSWVSFVKKSWRGLPTKVERLTVVYINGQMSDESRRVLDQKFNMDVDVDAKPVNETAK